MSPREQKERHDFALAATWEIDALSQLIIDQLGMLERTGTDGVTGLRGIAARILTVARATCAALGDEQEKVENIRQRLGIEDFGVFPNQQEVAS